MNFLCKLDRISIILLLNGCAAVTILGADPFNSNFLNGNEYLFVTKLGETFCMEEVFQPKGEAEMGAPNFVRQA